MALTILDGSLPWSAEMRLCISNLMRDFETVVHNKSCGKTTILLDDIRVTSNDVSNIYYFKMGRVPDPFGWKDQRDDRLDTDVVVTTYHKRIAKSKLDFFRPGEKEPFSSFLIRFATLGDDFVKAVPELFPKMKVDAIDDKCKSRYVVPFNGSYVL